MAQQYGAPQEVGRRFVGVPQVETVTSASLDAGFGHASARDGYGGRVGVGGLSASGGTTSRTHCVQQAQIDYVQPIDQYAVQQGRGLDIAGAIALGVLGLSIYGAAKSAYNVDVDAWESDYSFYQMDPGFFPNPGARPSEPTSAYTFGGVVALGGLAWAIYSLAALPKGPPPPPTRSERRWTETAFVESTGCGLVPADQGRPYQPPPPPPPQPY